MKIILRYCSVLLIGILLLTIASCRKESSVPQYAIPSDLQKIASGWVTGGAMKAEIYATSDLFVGYNKLYLALYDSLTNKRITQAQISISASYAQGVRNQSGPVENPSTVNADINGLFEAAVVFTQPSDNWTLNTYVEGISGQNTGRYQWTANVVQPTPARAFSVITQDDSTNLFVSLVQPATPKLGVNSFELAVYKQVNALSFVPDSGYNISIDAEMPSMSGMNSPNNVNPAYMSNGHYTGKVDFIMDGAWQINLSLLHNGMIADSSHYFALSF